MRFPRPSVALVIAVMALLLAAGGGAFAAARATGSSVNIVDPSVATQMAKVSSGGALQVGGSVTATQAAPVNFVRASAVGLGSGRCTTVMTPPSGKALVLTQVQIDVYQDPSPGLGESVALYRGAGCSFSDVIADVKPPTIGATVLPFAPGVAIPAGSAVSAAADDSVKAELYLLGYAVSASSVPAAPAASTATGDGQQQTP